MSDFDQLLNSLVTALKASNGDCEPIETHSAIVLLSGEFAYKFKKPVDFGFLDFSTAEKRKHFCREELALNQQVSNHIYLSLVSVVPKIIDLPDGSQKYHFILEEGELETACELGVKMRRFSQDKLFSFLAKNKKLTREQTILLGEKIVQLHKAAAYDQENAFGTFEAIHSWSIDNFTIIKTLLNNTEYQVFEQLRKKVEESERLLSDIFSLRKKEGKIRDCHGDLHLNNIVLLGEEPEFFDRIDFNPELRWIDVMNELAFLCMDFIAHEAKQLAHLILNYYLQNTGDYAGLNVYKYYLCYRAVVRVKVALLQQNQLGDNDDSQEKYKRLSLDVERYTQIAQSALRNEKKLIVITHGFSGSGKSVFAQQVAEKYGLIHIRSDVERKRQSNVEQSSKLNLYSEQSRHDVYARLSEIADSILNAGFVPLVDATFLSWDRREALRRFAQSKSCRLVILSCVARHETLIARLRQRSAEGNDPSDADEDVLAKQVASFDTLTEAERQCCIEIDTESTNPLEASIKQIDRVMNV